VPAGAFSIGGVCNPNRKYSPTEKRIAAASITQRTTRPDGRVSSVEDDWDEGAEWGDVIGRYSSGAFYIKEWHTIRGL
jgi:hypothetical protein